MLTNSFVVNTVTSSVHKKKKIEPNSEIVPVTLGLKTLK